MENGKWKMINYLKKNYSSCYKIFKIICEYSEHNNFQFSIFNFQFLLIIIGIILNLTMPSFAFEDCVIMTKGKLGNIKIQHNDVVDVFPMVTISNEKNTLIVHPLKEGQTKISVTKNDKEKVIFDINVTNEKTIISEAAGFETYTIDCPPGSYEYYFELDVPPDYSGNNPRFDSNSEKRLEEAKQYQNFIDNLDEPPVLRGEF